MYYGHFSENLLWDYPTPTWCPLCNLLTFCRSVLRRSWVHRAAHHRYSLDSRRYYPLYYGTGLNQTDRGDREPFLPPTNSRDTIPIRPTASQVLCSQNTSNPLNLPGHLPTALTSIGCVVPVTITLSPAATSNRCSPSGDFAETMHPTSLRFSVMTAPPASVTEIESESSISEIDGQPRGSGRG